MNNTMGSTTNNIIPLTGALANFQSRTFSGAELVSVLGFVMLAGITIDETGGQYKLTSNQDYDWLDADRVFTSAADAIGFVAPLVIQHYHQALPGVLGKVA